MSKDRAPMSVPIRPAFRSDAARQEFFAAYAAVMNLWPVPVESLDVPSAYGRTHVHVTGPADAPALVLLHAAGATATVWLHNVAEISKHHRVYAIDQIGDAGRSVHNGLPIRGPADFKAWLDSLFDSLDLTKPALAGHSYGAWLALNYALAAPQRIRKLVLFDPTDCVARLRLAYRLRALPLFIRPNAQAVRNFLAWETENAPLDPSWLRLAALAGEVRGSKLVLPRRPTPNQLRTFTVPTLVLLAENSKAIAVTKAAGNAQRMLQNVTITVLARATHHTIPTVDANLLNQELLVYLAD